MGHDPSVGAERGRSRASLIEAATRLFAERGPGAVSAREVAREAGVNYALIHRHFGTKDGLIKAVLAELSNQLDADLVVDESGADRAASFVEEHEQLWRILGYLCLENRTWVSEHVETHRGFDVLRAAVAREEPDPDLVAIRSGVGAAMVMGWVILGPFIEKLADLEHIAPEKVVAEFSATVHRALLPVASSIDLNELDLTADPVESSG